MLWKRAGILVSYRDSILNKWKTYFEDFDFDSWQIFALIYHFVLGMVSRDAETLALNLDIGLFMSY